MDVRDGCTGWHLAVLKWARSQGCPWDERTCEAAAVSGHLAVLQWAQAHGCPWDNVTHEAAARGGHLANVSCQSGPGVPTATRHYGFEEGRH